MIFFNRHSINQLINTQNQLHKNHVGLDDKPLLNELNLKLDSINLELNKIHKKLYSLNTNVNEIHTVKLELNNLTNNLNKNNKKVLISLCNINDLMATKPYRFDLNNNVGNIKPNSKGAQNCYSSMEIN